MKINFKYLYLIPIIVFILIIITVYWCFISACFITFNSPGIVTLTYFPSISETGGRMPEKIYFGIGLTTASIIFTIVLLNRFEETRNFTNFFVNFVFLFILGIIMEISISLVSLISMFENSLAHQIVTGIFFASVTFLFSYWCIQDIYIYTKTQNFPSTWIINIRGILILGIWISGFLMMTFMILISINNLLIYSSLESIFEHIIVILLSFFILTMSYDLYYVE